MVFKTILVTGSNGQVGFELCRALAPFGTILAPTRQELDLSDANAVEYYLDKYQPDLIVNPAAWTAVDAAETEQEQATRLNAELPKQLAKYAHKHQAYLVHYSTDYVYAGTGETPWLESDTPAPLSVYGRTKCAGDDAIAAHCKNHIIFRTSWVYSDRGNNFLKTMLKLGQQKDSLNIVNDQVGAPTDARTIAQVTALAVYRKLINQPIEPGVYHLVNRGQTTWLGFADAIFKLARTHDLPLKLTELGGISTAQFPTPAVRPANSRLNLDKIEKALGITLPNWQQQLELTFNSYIK